MSIIRISIYINLVLALFTVIYWLRRGHVRTFRESGLRAYVHFFVIMSAQFDVLNTLLNRLGFVQYVYKLIPVIDIFYPLLCITGLFYRNRPDVLKVLYFISVGSMFLILLPFTIANGTSLHWIGHLVSAFISVFMLFKFTKHINLDYFMVIFMAIMMAMMAEQTYMLQTDVYKDFLHLVRYLGHSMLAILITIKLIYLFAYGK